MRIVGREQARQMLGAIDTRSRSGLRAHAALSLAYRAGLTSGEICRLKRTDLDLDQGTIRTEGRIIAIDADAIESLRAWLGKAPKSEWLLCTYAEGTAGGPISDGDIRSACDRAAIAAGIDPRDVNPTILRDSHGAELADEGFTRQEIADRLGLRQLRSVERFFHVAAPDVAQRIQRRAQQPQLPEHASRTETRELREELTALRGEVERLDTRGDLQGLAARVEALEASLRDVRGLLDARESDHEAMAEMCGELREEFVQVAMAIGQRPGDGNGNGNGNG